jgi:hypothetical protein
MGHDSLESLLHFQHILVAVVTIVPPVMAAMMSLLVVATRMVVNALVVAVPVSIMGVEATGMFVCSHGVGLR